MLHVLNGDATAVVLAETGLAGERLVRRDILVGGVHLRRGGPLRRWDGARGRLVAPPE
jgi:hypothetical protein